MRVKTDFQHPYTASNQPHIIRSKNNILCSTVPVKLKTIYWAKVITVLQILMVSTDNCFQILKKSFYFKSLIFAHLF